MSCDREKILRLCVMLKLRSYIKGLQITYSNELWYVGRVRMKLDRP